MKEKKVMHVTYMLLMDKWLWVKASKLLWFSEWILNEWRVSDTDTIWLTQEEAVELWFIW